MLEHNAMPIRKERNYKHVVKYVVPSHKPTICVRIDISRCMCRRMKKIVFEKQCCTATKAVVSVPRITRPSPIDLRCGDEWMSLWDIAMETDTRV